MPPRPGWVDMLQQSLSLVLILAAASAGASEAPVLIPHSVPAGEGLLSGKLPASLDGRLGFAYQLGRAEGNPAGGKHWLLGRSVDVLGIQVNLRFSTSVGEEQARAIQSLGCVPARLESGVPASVGPVVSARCSWAGLWAISALPQVLRVEPTFDYRILRPTAPPIDGTNSEVEAAPLTGAFYPGGRGEGVTVCDIDSGLDPFHPMMFRADGGAYRWIDVNGNGVFDPLIDAVDFNQNGVADPGEKLGIIKGQMLWYDWYTGQSTFYNADPEFLAGYDWLYQDENNDGQRNFGPAAPYGDAKPTFGEQLYVADDVNKNGKLDLNEKVLRLNTPKIKAARIASTVAGPLTTYRRGQNLAQIPETYPGARDHGAMVLGTIGGGVPNVMRYSGIAPDVDLLSDGSDSQDLVSELAWAKSEGAQIVLWEMATWYGEFLDGSSALEVACDAASDLGVLQIGAAGNLGRSQKHRVMTHPTGTLAVPLTIPPGQANYVYGDFLWRGGALSFSVTINSQVVPLTGASGQVIVGSTRVQWGLYPGSRGTKMMLFYFSNPAGQMVPGQDVSFAVTNAGSPVALHGYVTDDYSSWSKGVFWPASTGSTDLGTYGTPGVGDKTLSIATYYSSLAPTGAIKGDLAYYSGMGPRLDGADTVDFASPEDHITAYIGASVPFGWYWIGGGTSNASPVAVGVAALLKADRPGATVAELTAMLHAQALVEPALMGTTPNDRWGSGKIRAYRAFFDGGVAPTDFAPVAAGTAVRFGTDGGLRVDATASTDPEGKPLSYRWDLDYDGTWDLDPTRSSPPTRSQRQESTG